MAISGFASRVGFTRIILIAVAGAAGSCAVLLSLSASATGAAPKCFGKPATIVGTPNADTLNGTAGRDVIVGRGGGDTIRGRGDNDLICGGAGPDEIKGESEQDRIKGGPGPDRLFGGEDRDKLFGGPSGPGGGPSGPPEDLLDGGDGADDLFGEEGDDFIRGDQGADKLFGEQGEDSLDGGAGPDDVFGGRGPDFLSGGPNPGVADKLFGGPGGDKLFGEQGEDNLFGGPDNDDLDGGEATDDCQQGAGTGTVVNCEADLAVDVVGPATASVGNITYTVTVTNNGPSTVGYTLVLNQDNSNLMCTGARGTQSEEALAPEATRPQNHTVTCVDEDAPGGQVSVSATVSGPPDPTPGNNQDSATTAVS